MKLDLLLADREIAVVKLFRNGIKTVAVVEVDQRALLVLQLIERWGFLKLSTQVCKFVITPYLLKAESLALFFVPCVIK